MHVMAVFHTCGTVTVRQPLVMQCTYLVEGMTHMVLVTLYTVLILVSSQHVHVCPLRPSPFFSFIVEHFAFCDFGSVGQKRKEKRNKKKLEKEFGNRRPGISV